MGVDNAWNPISVAIVASIAMGLHVFTGFVGCDFVEVTAKEGEVLAITETSAQEVANETSMGLICDGDFYDLNGDDMRLYSRLFYYAATGVGGLCVMLAWAISTCCTPTIVAWRLVAFLSSLSALASLPIFLVLETYPCEDFEEQSCSLSWDSYCLMGAVGLHVLVTTLTQFLDPPDWVSQLHHWRVPKGRSMDTDRWSSGEDEEGSTSPILTPRLEAPKNRLSWCGSRKKSSSKDRRERTASRPMLPYALPPTDIEQGDSLVEEEVVSTQESDQPPEKSENWTPFEPNTNLFREKQSMNVTSDADENMTMNQAPSHPTHTPQDDVLEPPSLSPWHVGEPGSDVLGFNPEPPSTPPIPHYRVEQVPVSPLTHHTNGSAPTSPSIDRSMVQDPIVKHSSRVSTPNRSVGEELPARFNESEMTTPIKRMQWSNEESILDGIVNGDDSLLDRSVDRNARSGVPFIPTVDESRKMATQGYSVYADLEKGGKIRASEENPPRQYDIDKLVNRSEMDSSLEDSQLASEAVYADLEKETEQPAFEENEPAQYNIDELVSRRVNQTSVDDSLLDSEDIRAIAVKGAPIYASLLLDYGDSITKKISSSRESLQPVMNIKRSLSAEEYLLQTSLSGDRKQDDSKREENRDAKVDKSARNNIVPSLRQSNRGYDKLADLSGSDEELEGPPMTEVSFDPREIQEVSLDKDEVHQPKSKMEKDLLDEWNKIFDTHGPIPVKIPGNDSDDNDEEEDRRDEEELLRLISSEDFSDDSPKSGGDENDQNERAQSQSLSSSPNKPPRSGGKSTLRPKRRLRRSRSRASGSVGSAPSLLDVTIEEETQSDLEEFNKDEERGRRLQKSGTKDYGLDEVQRVTAGVQEILKRSRSRSIDFHTKSAGNLAVTPSSSTNRMSTWRSERENRASIHDPVVVSDEEKDAGDNIAKDLRQSRIQRLQTPEISAIARARMRRDRFFGEMNHPHSTNYKINRTEHSEKQKDKDPKTWANVSHRTKDPLAHTSSVNQPVQLSHVAAGDDGSQTTTPDEGIGEVGSFLLGSLNVDIGDLDVSLAALSRPDGSEYGPDEHSI